MDNLKVEEIYKAAVDRLDNFYSETQAGLVHGYPPNNWKGETIFNLLHQSTNVLSVLLNLSEGSKYRSNTFITEHVIIGSLGRILRDIFVNIIYLTTDKFSEEEMKLCWTYQIACQKLNSTKHLNNVDTNYRIDWEIEKKQLEAKIHKLSFETKGQVIVGKCERLLSINELADIKGFNKDVFMNEFEYFSQFSHSSAFANSISKPGENDIRILAVTYMRILIYYVGIVTESLRFINPETPRLAELEEFFKIQVQTFWN